MTIISVAPMMDYTDRHDRYFLRLIAPNVHLYTEMITTHALIHGDSKHLLRYHPAEKYLALQLGGNNAADLAYCAQLGEAAGYDEINLNVGCPSDRVKEGRFGACLMLEPNVVADAVHAMQQQVTIPVTVKCRLGVDHQDSYASLVSFIELIAAAGCKSFIIHARKAWLSGLSPKENREIPPLQYEKVYAIKKDFPDLNIIINGGIKTLADINHHLAHVDGVMIGRAAYHNPYLLAEVENQYFAANNGTTRYDIIRKILPYIQHELTKGERLNAITRHLLGLFQGQFGANRWRRYLSEHACKPGVGIEVIQQALAEMNGVL